MSEWIKVCNRDEMPNGEVLAISEQHDYLVGWLGYWKQYDAIVCEQEGHLLIDVTHYMLLPQPPKTPQRA